MININKLFLFALALVALAIGVYLVAGRKTQPPTRETSETEASIEQKQAAKVETAQLTPVAPYKGSGVATRSFDGNTFVNNVTAELADPPEGKFYEGWLVKKKPVLTFLSTGKMVKENAKYTLSFTDSRDYPDYIDVVVTEETESMGLDGKPEAHVLEGTFSY